MHPDAIQNIPLQMILAITKEQLAELLSFIRK